MSSDPDFFDCGIGTSASITLSETAAPQAEILSARSDPGTGPEEAPVNWYLRPGGRFPEAAWGRAKEFANIACFLGCAINVDGRRSSVV
jgi:hypothetical protein